ncbi:MAG: hypothetical protein IPN61_10940 [Bacteroidetes bacterium]|nr:hypothetical protein [Bacteroidota bacterium]
MIHPPCINSSEYVTSIVAVDYLSGLHSFRKDYGKTVGNKCEERNEHGDYKSLEDFTKRVSIESNNYQFSFASEHFVLPDARRSNCCGTYT